MTKCMLCSIDLFLCHSRPCPGRKYAYTYGYLITSENAAALIAAGTSEDQVPQKNLSIVELFPRSAPTE